jgi:5-methyltetrahydropteroyltriglutamate--homocysteine methyltransferase
MHRSTDRILTTHVGSLIRPPEVRAFLRARANGEQPDENIYQAQLSAAVAKIVAQQVAAGVDVVSDGEFGKAISWSQYALERLSGFERKPIQSRDANPFNRGADRTRFAEFYAELDEKDGVATTMEAVCTGAITYTGQAAVQRDIANLKAALAGSGATEGFLPVAAPASVIPDRRNVFYKNDDDMLTAIADAMHHEYKAITDAGLIVQLDDARAAVTYDRMVPPGSFEDYHRWVARQMEVINHALKGIPPSQVRYHVCWGSWPGPHTTDVPMRKIIDLILSANAGAYVLEMANPRHEHEWQIWKDVKLPEGKILIPGVISHATNVVEHPELVAERITRLARLVGRERVIAGTDCGFAQGPFYQRVHPSIMWAKLEAMAEGAKIASRELWK